MRPTYGEPRRHLGVTPRLTLKERTDLSLTRSRTVVIAAVVAVFALFTAACSSNADDVETGTTTGDTSSSSAYDYESLSGTLNGSGATFPKAFYEDAIAAFQDVAPNVTVNYGGGGSGKGKTDLASQVVDWAGSDSTVKEEDVATFKGGAFLYFPTVAAPITVSYNLDGVSELQLSPDTLAKIFQAQITTWNDPAIEADNPDASLPSTPIVVVHRSDGSGTTSNFTKYLKAAAPSTWTLDAGDTVNWPASTQAGNGNAGVAQAISAANGAIGYVDLSDAKATNLTFASLKNKDGEFVAPTLDGATAALENAEVKDDLTYSALNAAGAEAYPITAGTYIIVYAKQTNAGTAAALKGWINFVLTQGQELAPDVDFAPLPTNLQDKAIAQLDEITTS
jgi:phosphate transport system substrate-binding protein